jgi:hypothetical protein
LIATVAGQAVARAVNVITTCIVVTGTALRALGTPSAIRAWIGAHFTLYSTQKPEVEAANEREKKNKSNEYIKIESRRVEKKRRMVTDFSLPSIRWYRNICHRWGCTCPHSDSGNWTRSFGRGFHPGKVHRIYKTKKEEAELFLVPHKL